MFNNFLGFFLLGSGGAIALELLKLYEYRGKLTQKKYKKLMKSYLFWGVVLGMVLASGFIAWALHAESKDSTVWNVVMTGIAARSLVREIGAVRVSNSTTKLGEEEQEKISMKDIFS